MPEGTEGERAVRVLPAWRAPSEGRSGRRDGAWRGRAPSEDRRGRRDRAWRGQAF